MWVFNTRHDFGVETDPTQGESFVNNVIDRRAVPSRALAPASLPPDFCFLFSALCFGPVVPSSASAARQPAHDFVPMIL